jgi:lipoprotein NlpI
MRAHAQTAPAKEAIAACTRAINSGRWSGPGLAWAYNGRGNAYRAKGDNDRAIADYSEALSIDPKYFPAYFSRGRLYLYGGSIAKAQADFKQMKELNPKDAYAALWLDIAERRNNIPSHLAQAAKELDMTAWPAPVVRLLLGQMTPAEVLAAADNPDAKTKKGQICEANFYSGELALSQGTKDEAIR